MARLGRSTVQDAIAVRRSRSPPPSPNSADPTLSVELGMLSVHNIHSMRGGAAEEGRRLCLPARAGLGEAPRGAGPRRGQPTRFHGLAIWSTRWIKSSMMIIFYKIISCGNGKSILCGGIG
ncbi:hypothetical protein ZWY2020_048609 [Hordeum vulgare]|nr:hypothetical protein ZWY2020_048609 [Hordeum vulgare]